MKTEIKILHLIYHPKDAVSVEQELNRGNFLFQIVVVGSKLAFIKALENFVPNLIISDHAVPSFDALEAINIIKQKQLNIPFIVVTSPVSETFAVDIMKAGAEDYILKAAMHRLPQAIEKALKTDGNTTDSVHEIYNHAHLAAIVNATNEAIISKLSDGTITSWNSGAENLFGYSAADMLGKNTSIIIPPDFMQEESDFMESIKNGKPIKNFETVRLTHSGTRVDVSLTITPLEDSCGKVIGAALIIYNITDRKNAEQGLYDSEEKYQSFVENSTDGILITVTDGRILSANSAACAIFNMSEEEICQAGRFGLVDNEDPRVASAIQERRRTGKVKTEVTLVRKDGEHFPGELISVVYKNANGEERTSMIVKDLSKTKQVQQHLTESEQFNKAILTALNSHIAVIDNTGNIITVNKAWDDFAKTNGIDPLVEVSTGSNYLETCQSLMIAGNVSAGQTLLGIQSVFNKEVNTFEIEYPSPSLTGQLWFNLSAMNFGDDDSKIVISHQDITKRKAAENNLKITSAELQKALSELHITLDSSLDVICTINTDGQFVNVSAASKQIWGYEPKELIGEKFINLVYHEDIEKTSTASENIINGIKVPFFENRYVHKSGKIVPLLWSVNWNEKLQVIFCIAKDVTEKISLEKAIENERDQFYEMFLKAPSAIGMLKGAHHVFEMANPLYLQLTGKSDIIGKPVAEVLPEVVEQGFISLLDHVYQTGESYVGSEVLVKIDKKGTGDLVDFYVDFIYQAYRNSKGDIEGVFFFMNDITEQIVSRKETEKSEKQYRQIVETAQEGIWLIDENSKTTFVNKKMCEILGYSEDELIGKPHSYYMDTSGKEKVKATLKRRKKGIAERTEFGFISKHGKHIRTEVSANPIFDDLGNFKGSLGMVSDVTDKKHLEDLLEKSNRLARIGSWEIDVVEGSVFWSDITKEIREADKDYKPQLDVGISYFEEGIHKETINRRVQECIEYGTPWDEELQILTFKGNHKWVRTIGEGEFLNGKCIKIHGSFQDITERKNAVEKVIRSEAKLKVAQQIAQVGSWEINLITHEHSWSDEYYRILEIDSNVIPNRDVFLSRVHPEDRAMASRVIEKAFLKYADSSFHFRFKRKNGDIRYASSEWKFEFDTFGNPLYIHGIIRDLTKERKAESERVKMISDIVQRNSDLEQFSYMVSHNLRAPTANIIGFAEILLDETYTSQERKTSLQGLSASVMGLDTVIKDINTILQSKYEVHGKKEIVVFSKLVNDIKLSLNNLIEKHRVQIITDFSEVDELYSLKIYIYSIFYNLISNSIKYGKPNEPPFIIIKSIKENGKIILTFKDHGLGIDMNTKGDKIFGLYARFHSHVEGKGMGLFIVKTQVESLGGKINVVSELNKGTKFTVEFDI